MVTGEHNRYFDLLITPLKDQNGLLNGRLIVLRDVTGRKEAEMAVLRANEKLQRQLVEIEALQSKLYDLAIRDPLTRLFNRRYLEETLERELLKAGREKKTVSLMMIDIDHFKKFNDQYGHKAGDLILENLGPVVTEIQQGRRRGLPLWRGRIPGGLTRSHTPGGLGASVGVVPDIRINAR